MRSLRLITLFALALSLVAAQRASAYDCPYSPGETTRVTKAGGRSRTARDNARCICVDPSGTAHMVWEDERNGNFEIYYAAMVGDSVLPAVRITYTRGESFYPCVACDSENVYVVWRETVDDLPELRYVRLTGGVVAARKRIVRSFVEASCPVSAMGPDGVLHLAWHEGPYKQTAVYYGQVIADSLVLREPIGTKSPEAFRPDIACDPHGRVLIAWFEGLQTKAKLRDDGAWGEETLVATGASRAWRLSVANLSEGRWAAAWFDKTEKGSDVLVKFFNEEEWYGETKVSSANVAYYPNMIGLGNGNLAVVWEVDNKEIGEYSIVLRCYNGQEWSTPLDIYKEGVAGRYASLAVHDDLLHAVWFSGKVSSDEIYHLLLRRK